MSKNFLLLLSVFWLSCGHQNKTGQLTDGYITTASGLKYKIIKEGSGEPAKTGQEVLIFETVSYLNGTLLYSNENTGNPVKVLLGGNQVTAASEEALQGMRAGEIRNLVAPANLVKRKMYPPNLSPDSALNIRLILYKIL